MQATPARWSVVATVAERPEPLLAFAAHHALLGAHRIHLYLDRPDPDLKARLEQVPGCDVTLCDDAHWKRLTGGARPKPVEARQIENAADAYRRSDADWLAHLDGDEFISCTRELGIELAHVPEAFSLVHLDVRERVYLERDTDPDLFSGVFRKHYKARFGNQQHVLGDLARYADGGFFGHAVGKCLVRTGREGLIMGIHRPRPMRTEGRRMERPRRITASSAVLLHFDGLTERHWIEKVKRYCTLKRPEGDMRRAQARRRLLEFFDAHMHDYAALLAFHRRMKVLSKSGERTLRALGLIEDAAIDPRAGLAHFGLADSLDLSARSFDRAPAAAQESGR